MCDEVTDFNTRDNPLTWQDKLSWEEVLAEVKAVITKYLDAGKHSSKLKKMNAIACGFVDGDIDIIYTKNSTV